MSQSFPISSHPSIRPSWPWTSPEVAWISWTALRLSGKTSSFLQRWSHNRAPTLQKNFLENCLLYTTPGPALQGAGRYRVRFFTYQRNVGFPLKARSWSGFSTHPWLCWFNSRNHVSWSVADHLRCSVKICWENELEASWCHTASSSNLGNLNLISSWLSERWSLSATRTSALFKLMTFLWQQKLEIAK